MHRVSVLAIGSAMPFREPPTLFLVFENERIERDGAPASAASDCVNRYWQGCTKIFVCGNDDLSLRAGINSQGVTYYGNL